MVRPDVFTSGFFYCTFTSAIFLRCFSWILVNHIVGHIPMLDYFFLFSK